MSITAQLKKSLPDRFQVPVSVRLREAERPDNAAVVEEISRALAVPHIVARILACRGISSQEAAAAFLHPTLKEHLEDPLCIKNMRQAAIEILEAVKEGRHITIFSDFDVDGITGAVQVLLFLAGLGADVDVYIPNRFTEGYGLSADAVEKLARTGTKLLVTVDCGISSIRELALARRLGMRSVVLDHHEPGQQLPPADVVVDPAQEGCPFRQYAMAAAGLAWMLLIVMRTQALDVLGEKARDKLEKLHPKDFLDLAAVGTICDMVPLTGMNRLIAYRGLEALQKCARPGLMALREAAGLSNRKVDCSHIAYVIGPRINAAGRLGDATEVVSLFTTHDSIKAKSIAHNIDRLNAQRRAVEEQVLSACLLQISQDEQALERRALALYGKEFHTGVIGIVAQRLVERFGRPAVVLGPGEMMVDGELRQVVKGSVRSVDGFHVAEALQSLSHLLLAHGGHAAAGGLSVSFDNLDAFKEGFFRAAQASLAPEDLQRRVLADLKLSLADVDFDLAVALSALAPFGVGNPAPVFVSEGVRVETVTLLGDKHLRLRISEGQACRGAVAWGMSGHPLLRKGELVNAAYQIELNSYKGVSSVQLNLKEVWR